MKLFASKQQCSADGGSGTRNYRWHPQSKRKSTESGCPKFYHRKVRRCHDHKDARVAGDEDEEDEEAPIPRHIAAFSHCLMDRGCGSENGDVFPLVLDVDAKFREDAEAVDRNQTMQTAVRFAVYALVKFLVEYIVRNSPLQGKEGGSGEGQIPKRLLPDIWMCDASGVRASPPSKGGGSGKPKGAFKFSCHIVVRFPLPPSSTAGDCGKLGSDVGVGDQPPLPRALTFKRTASSALCALLNRCMAVPRITFCLAGAPEQETLELHRVMETAKATLRSMLIDPDLKGGMFDEQIYKNGSLRLLGAQSPTGGNELRPVDSDTGEVLKSIWDMGPAARDFLVRMHDPFPCPEELSKSAAVVPFETVAPLVIDSSDDEGDGDASRGGSGKGGGDAGSSTAYNSISSFMPQRQSFSVARSTLNIYHQGNNRVGDAGGNSSSANAMAQLTLLSTRLFEILCRECLPTAKLPRKYAFRFRQVKLCRPYNGDNDEAAHNALVIKLQGGDGAGALSSLLGQKHYYEVQSQASFCPWKSARARSGSGACTGTCSSDEACHNQNRVRMEIHPKAELQEASVRLVCFSSKCIAGMSSGANGNRPRVAIARYPASVDQRPTMEFVEVMRKFAKLAATGV